MAETLDDVPSSVGAPRRGRGRPRSTAVRTATIEAAVGIALAEGVDKLSIDGIAQEAGVSRTTIYKWWHSPAAVLLDGMLERERYTIERLPGTTAREAMRDHVLALQRIAVSETGELLRQVLAAAARDQRTAAELRERWLQPRRDAALTLIAEGVAAGQLPRAVEPAVLLDAMIAPIYHRLMFQLAPLTARDTLDLLDLTWPVPLE